MKLVIVESPTKAKTISRFLGREYTVDSSYGHVRDLPKGKLGVDVEHNFEPTYVVPTEAKKHLTALKKLAAKADTVYYATDQDREGEAIAWHLSQAFDIPDSKEERITFHEITEHAINEALEHPRKIWQHVVDAQQARRILDRLVGYKLSPLLWKKVSRGLSAGRVQSVAVRLVVEREREIQSFKEQEYWTVEADANTAKPETFHVKLHAWQTKTLDKLALTSRASVDVIIEALAGQTYAVANVERRDVHKQSLPPFRTATLQQEANRRFGFSAKLTMRLAQQLYEGVPLGSSGHAGLITYMRTDSLNLSEKFMGEAADFITQQYGAEAAVPRRFKSTAKGAQEAHEAIRPSEAARTPDSIKEYLTPQQYKLYWLVWARAIASQMAPAQLAATTIDIADAKQQAIFRATGQIIVKPGFSQVYPTISADVVLPAVEVGQTITLAQLDGLQHFTQPPARYSDATLIKTMEEKGIGRPSTYAPTIATIIARGYVERDERRLKPTDIAFIVNDLLVEHFPDIVDYNFTAKMEDNLDEIAEGHLKWQPVIAEFYGPFAERLEQKTNELSRQELAAMRELGNDPTTGEPISIRRGRWGVFVQRGSAEDKSKKPAFASVPKNMPVDNVTLGDALLYLSLPKTLGQDSEGNDVIVGIGRFGPYVKWAGQYASIPPTEDPYLLKLDQALVLIAEKKDHIAKTLIKEFPETGVSIKNGRFGPYITDGKKNAKVPKDTDPASLSLEQCQALLAAAKPSRGGAWRKKKKTETE